MAKFKTCTVICGDESYLLDREKRKALAWPDRNIVSLDGKDCTEAQIISELEQISFDGTGTAVVLDEADRVKVGKGLLEYLDGRDPADTSSVLVAICRKATPPKAWAEVAAKGRLVTHKRFKPWETEAIQKKVYAEGQLLDLKISDDALSTLHRVYADNIGGMVNELGKLSFLVPKGGTVTKEHVLLVCPRQLPVMPWDVSESAAKKASKQALTYTSLLFKYEGEGAAVPIVAALQRQVEQLLVARSLLDKGASTKTISEALGMNAYVFEKKVLPMVHKHSVSSLVKHMQDMCTLETKVKGAALSKRTLVELAVLSFATA